MAYDLNIRGWMPEIELKVIEKWAQLVPENGIIVEIGSLHGRSATCWALSARTSTVYATDLFCDYVSTQIFDDAMTEYHNFPRTGDVTSLEVFINNTKHIPNIIPVKADHFPIIPKELDNITPNLLFLDALHKNPSDWDILEAWLPRIAPGGIICGHDYGLHEFPDVVENAQRLCKMLGKSLETEFSLWKIQL